MWQANEQALSDALEAINVADRRLAEAVPLASRAMALGSTSASDGNKSERHVPGKRSQQLQLVIKQLSSYGKGTHRALVNLVNKIDMNHDGKITVSELHKAFNDKSDKYGVLKDITLEVPSPIPPSSTNQYPNHRHTSFRQCITVRSTL